MDKISQYEKLLKTSNFYFPYGYNGYLIDDISTRSKVDERDKQTRRKAERYYGMNNFPNEMCCMVAYAQYEGNDSLYRYGDARDELTKQFCKKNFDFHDCRIGDKDSLFVGCHITPRQSYDKYDKLKTKFEKTPNGETYNRPFLIDGAPNILIFCDFTGFLFDHGLLTVWPIPFGDSGTLRLEFR